MRDYSFLRRLSNKKKTNGSNTSIWTSMRNIFIHSFFEAISIAPLAGRYYSEALPTQNGYCVGVSRRSAIGNCELRTCPGSLYVAARAGFEPTTLRSRGFYSTKAPPHLTFVSYYYN